MQVKTETNSRGGCHCLMHRCVKTRDIAVSGGKQLTKDWNEAVVNFHPLKRV